MDQIAIIPLSSPTAKPIKIFEEKTVIGRGPFLQVTDKRVSRSHAVLEVQDGKLYLTPTHTNPCFFKKSSKAPVEIMKKDEKRLMYNNQIFGLLPDSLFFQVTCPAVQNGTEEGSEKEETDEEASGSESEEEEEPKEKPKPQKLKHQPSIGRKSLEGRDILMPLDKKRILPNWLIQIAKQPPPGANPIAPPVKRPVAVSPPKPPKPKTPSRPKKTESEEDEDFDVKEERRRQYNTPAKKPKKKYKEESEEDWEAEEEYSPKKSTSRRGGSAVKPRKKARDSSEEDWDSDESPKKKKKKEKKKEKKKHQAIKVGRRRRHSSDEDGPSTSRPSRTARTKKASYAEDFVLPDEFSDEDDLPAGSLSKEEDSDFVMDDGDESGSDWEASQRSKGKGKSSKGTPKRTPKRRGKKSYADSEDDISEEDEYVPRSSKKRQGSSAKKGRKKKQESSEEEEESEPEYKPKARNRGSAKKGKKHKDLSASEEESEDEKPKKKSPAAKKNKKKEDSGGEEEEKEDKRNKIKKVKQLDSKHRPPCMFGKKCYRKNPEHFTDFSHPGDQSFDELEEDEDRPDCPYGPSCYRTNASHLKQYRHSNKARENKPETKAKKKGVDEEEDTGPNTYDYNDSFINDESQGKEESEEDSGGSEGDGSEEGDESGDDVSKLKKEAKSFIKNKKMTKPV